MIELLKEIEEKNIELSLNGDNLELRFDDEELDQEILTKIKSNKEDLIFFLKKYSSKEYYQPIEAAGIAESYPVSHNQKRMWVLGKLEGNDSVWNLANHIYLDDSYDINCFEKAVYKVIERHESLRTVFKENSEGDVHQWILPFEELNFKIDHLDFRAKENPTEAGMDYVGKDSIKKFDLENGPLIKVQLIQIKDKEFIFYYNMQHIISDGWSYKVLVKDIMTYYEAFVSNTNADLPELKVHYKDFSVWQLNQLKEGAFEAHSNFWMDKLSGDLPVLDLPSRKKRPKVMTYNGRRLTSWISKETVQSINTFTQENDGSLFMFLLASWNVLFHKYLNQNDIIVGTLVAGRDHLDLNAQIGYYVNTLALRNHIDSNETFVKFFERVKTTTLESFKYQAYPFDLIGEELGLKRDTSRNQIVDGMLILHNNIDEKKKNIELNAQELNEIKYHGSMPAKFAIEIDCWLENEGIQLDVKYNSDVNEDWVMKNLLKHFKKIVSELVANPNKKIANIELIDEKEQQELLHGLNDTYAEYFNDKTIIDLIEEQVIKTPNKIALICGDNKFTYQELSLQSNQFANFLKEKKKVKVEDLVCMKLDRSEYLLIAILGLIKVGGVYVPVDPNHPKDRIQYIEDSCKFSIDQSVLNDFIEIQDELSAESIKTTINSNSLIYIIHTSGSTGRPKGVMIEHGNLMSFLPNLKQVFSFDKIETFAATANVTFDISIIELLGTLTCGITIDLFATEVLNDPEQIAKRIEENQLQGLQVTPSRCMQLLLHSDKFLQSLNVLLIGAESLNNSLYNKLKDLSTEVIFIYGTTETTIWDTALLLNDSEYLSIGKPMKNDAIFLFDDSLKLVPKGVVGEIYIGGKGIARGYLNLPELTKERFIDNPYLDGERLYKTGDLARWLSDGSIDFLGRNDDQVKVRGYRIELGEVESVLQTKEDLEAATVLTNINEDDEQELVAYIVSDVEQSIGELRNHLLQFVPDYMVPAHFIQLEKMPLTPSGKTDKKYLKDLQNLEIQKYISEVEYVAPETDTQKILVDIWAEVLKVEKIGIKDNFFNLGGNSINGLRIIVQVQKAFNIKINIAELFNFSSIEEFAEEIESQVWHNNEVDSDKIIDRTVI